MDLKGIGTYEIGGRELECNFSISADDFFDMFGDIVADTPSSVLEVVRKAIESRQSVRFSRRERDDIETFFERVRAENERREMESAGEEDASEEQEYGLAESAEGVEKELSESEGGVSSADDANGLKATVIFEETSKAEYEHNAEEPIEGSLESSGKLLLKNPSSDHRLWDIYLDLWHRRDIEWKSEDIQFEEIEGESTAESGEEIKKMRITLKELSAGDEVEYEYDITDKNLMALKLYEFISTINDEDVESYALHANEKNTILFKLTVKNTADYPIKDVEIKKEFPHEYNEIEILGSDDGSQENVSVEDKNIVWKIDEIDAESERTIKFTASIEVEESIKVRTGKISVNFGANKTLTGMGLSQFKAASTNFVGIEESQDEKDPDSYTCKLVFRNKSDFIVNLKNVEVHEITEEGEKEENLVEFPEDSEIYLSAGMEWVSEAWQTRVSEGNEPSFKKNVEFYVVAAEEISSAGMVTINDIELATAMIEGKVYYSVSQLESYRQTTFYSLLEAVNSGNADFNDLIFEDKIPSGYIPPTAEQIEVYLIRGKPPTAETGEIEAESAEVSEEAEAAGAEVGEIAEKESPAEVVESGEGVISEDRAVIEAESAIDWDNLGEKIEIDPSLITIEPADQDSAHEHLIKIDLSNLKDGPLGLMTPETKVRVKFPILADKPPMGTEFEPVVKFTANTLPAGQPITIVPESEDVVIPIIHIRKKLRRGKEIKALEEPHQYLITLSVTNLGEYALEDIKVRDLVDPNMFDYGEFSHDLAEESELGEKKVLIWNIERIEPGDTVEITYKITGKGDYRASDSQHSL